MTAMRSSSAAKRRRARGGRRGSEEGRCVDGLGGGRGEGVEEETIARGKYNALDLLVAGVAGEAQGLHVVEPFLVQELPPPGGVEQGRVGQAPARVFEEPPAFGQAQGEGGEVLRPRRLEQHQPPTRPQQGLEPPERPLEIARGVHDVGRQYDVDGRGAEALGAGLFLEVERAKAREGVRGAEGALAVPHEASGQVGVEIIDRVSEGREGFEHEGARAAGAGADLEQAHAGRGGSFAPAPHLGDGGRCDQLVVVVGEAIAFVNALDEGHRPAGKEHLGRRLCARENLRAGAGASFEQAPVRLQLGEAARHVFGVEGALEGIGRGVDDQAGAVRVQMPGALEHRVERGPEAGVGREDAEGDAHSLGGDGGARRGQGPEPAQHAGEQGVAAAGEHGRGGAASFEVRRVELGGGDVQRRRRGRCGR